MKNTERTNPNRPHHDYNKELQEVEIEFYKSLQPCSEIVHLMCNALRTNKKLKKYRLKFIAYLRGNIRSNKETVENNRNELNNWLNEK